MGGEREQEETPKETSGRGSKATAPAPILVPVVEVEVPGGVLEAFLLQGDALPDAES